MKKVSLFIWLISAMIIFPGYTPRKTKTAQTRKADVIIYGGTSAAITAAVQVKKMGKSVIIVSPDTHLGGLSSGGLGFTDTGNKEVIGGLSREFYQRLYTHYQKPESWNWQKKEEYGNKGQGTPAIDGNNRTMWIFEPHAAEQVFEDFAKEYQLTIYRNEWLDRSKKGVTKQGTNIHSFRTLSGNTYEGQMFIDVTYEGDLMAAAGVSYHVGREANSVYGEKWNGVQTEVFQHGHHFKSKISPYKIPNDPKSGLLPEVSAAPAGEYGAGDNKIQAYCFRMCLSNSPDNHKAMTLLVTNYWQGYLLRAGERLSINMTRFRTVKPIPIIMGLSVLTI
jgi:hypothetical protein